MSAKPKYRPANCDCGEPAVRKVASAWQCERCLNIRVDDYHGMIAGRKPVNGPTANELLEEWKEANPEMINNQATKEQRKIC